jgi:chromate transport protein ChrA
MGFSKGFDWAGMAVLILAAAIASALVVAMVGLVWHNGTLSPEAADIISAVSGSTISIIAVYVGQAASRRRPPE